MSCSSFAQILLGVAYNERADVFSFGFTLLEIVLGDCTYIKRHFKGQACVVSKANGGLGWRPPVPNELAVSQPDVALLFADCVVNDFNERPSFVEICTILEGCVTQASELDEHRLCASCDRSTAAGVSDLDWTSSTSFLTDEFPDASWPTMD